MANEITATASLSMSNSGRADSLSKVGLQVDMTGLDYTKQTQNVATSEAALSIPTGIGTPGWCMMINRSSTYDIKVRAATGLTDLIVMKPGEFCLFRMQATAPFVIAVTGAAALEYFLIEA